LKGNNSLLNNNNGNNSLPLSINTFGLRKGFNLLLNNNNSPSGRLNPNVIVLVNALTEMNLTREYFSREGNFIKLTEFARTKTKDLNKWLKMFNQIAEAN